jgi:surface polysaccharide O-acyltransferase-like enzyme
MSTTPITTGSPTSRIQSVDTFRVLAILAVIALHVAQVAPAGIGTRFDAATLMDGLERFAVPMFFTLSGYFWAAKAVPDSKALSQAVALARRVLLLFAWWCLVYAVVEFVHLSRHAASLAAAFHSLSFMHMARSTLLFQGTKVHLWFLPALAMAALIAGACLARGRWALLCFVAAALFIIGLGCKAYAPALGIHPRFNSRNGPFFSLAMFVAGIALRRIGPKAAWWWQGLLIASAGLALQLVEVSWLHVHWGTSMVQDYVVGTMPYGVGMAMVALSNARMIRMPALAGVGPLVLGIYASHFLFINLLYPLQVRFSGVPGWEVAYVALVFGCAWLTSMLLARWGPTRRFVM